MSETPEQARARCHAHHDPVNMDGRDVVCWECGNPRVTSRDEVGHAYCALHREMWGLVDGPCPPTHTDRSWECRRFWETATWRPCPEPSICQNTKRLLRDLP